MVGTADTYVVRVEVGPCVPTAVASFTVSVDMDPMKATGKAVDPAKYHHRALREPLTEPELA